MYAIEIMSKNGGSVKLGVQNRLKDSIFNRKVTLDLYPNEIAVVYDYFNVHSRYRNFWNKDFTPMLLHIITVSAVCERPLGLFWNLWYHMIACNTTTTTKSSSSFLGCLKFQSFRVSWHHAIPNPTVKKWLKKLNYANDPLKMIRNAK